MIALIRRTFWKLNRLLTKVNLNSYITAAKPQVFLNEVGGYLREVAIR